MSNLNEKHEQVLKLISSYTLDELAELNQIIFEERKYRGLQHKSTFRVGELVQVEGRKSGGWVGTISKINPKKLVIIHHETQVHWTVPPTMVKKLDKDTVKS